MHRPPRSKHGVLLFVHPTATRLLSPDKRDTPLGSTGYDVATYLSVIFDEDTALLRPLGGQRIPGVRTDADPLQVRRRTPTSTSGTAACTRSRRSATSSWRSRRAIAEGEFSPVEKGEFLTEEAPVHLFFRDEAWRKGLRHLTAWTADKSLFVSIGGTTTALRPGANADVRAVMLSVYEGDNDDDYMDDSEELEDWDSSNEEEEYEKDQDEDGSYEDGDESP
ncbi:hypothetical protein Hte_002004 [Hypoxylon texense]